eukprot:gene1531-60_t
MHCAQSLRTPGCHTFSKYGFHAAICGGAVPHGSRDTPHIVSDKYVERLRNAAVAHGASSTTRQASISALPQTQAQARA